MFCFNNNKKNLFQIGGVVFILFALSAFVMSPEWFGCCRHWKKDHTFSDKISSNNDLMSSSTYTLLALIYYCCGQNQSTPSYWLFSFILSIPEDERADSVNLQLNRLKSKRMKCFPWKSQYTLLNVAMNPFPTPRDCIVFLCLMPPLMFVCCILATVALFFYPFVHGFHLRYITNYTYTNPQTKEQIGWDFKPEDKSWMTAIEFLILAEGSVAPKSELLLKVSVQWTFA